MNQQTGDGLIFEALKVGGSSKGVLSVERARVPGGWLVVAYLMATMSFKTASMTFFFDPGHTWDGSSLP